MLLYTFLMAVLEFSIHISNDVYWNSIFNWHFIASPVVITQYYQFLLPPLGTLPSFILLIHMLWSSNVFYHPVYYNYCCKQSYLFDHLRIRKIDFTFTSIYFFSNVLILSRFFSYLLDFLQFRYDMPICEGSFGCLVWVLV